LRLRNLMERIIQYIKDRTEDFDDYIPCRRERRDKGHARMPLSSIGFMVNEVYLNKYFGFKASRRRRSRMLVFTEPMISA
jgi:hypothetical protein